MDQFANKVAVITGGGSGLGRELALGCARRGMNLVLADVDEAGMAETERLAQAEHAAVQVLRRRVDVTKLEQLEALATAALERFGGAHLLINNAGVAMGGPIWENSVADWHWVVGVNLYGVAWGIKAFVPVMLRQGEGYIVNIASAAGWVNGPGSGIYNVTKCGVVAMSETLVQDLKDVDGRIGVSVVSPAFFPTPILDSARNRPAELAETGPASKARLRREAETRHAVSHGRLSAAEVADKVLAGVAKGQFYIFPHQRFKELILARAQAAMEEHIAYDTLAGRG